MTKPQGDMPEPDCYKVAGYFFHNLKCAQFEAERNGAEIVPLYRASPPPQPTAQADLAAREQGNEPITEQALRACVEVLQWAKPYVARIRDTQRIYEAITLAERVLEGKDVS